MIDLLVISHACFTAINRNIYQLFLKDGWNVEIVVPETLKFPTGVRKADTPMADDPPIHFIRLNGDNPRTYDFEGLPKLLEERKPRIVLIDNDPVSRMALKTGKWCRENNSSLFCISCENLSLEIPDTIRRRGVKALPGALAKRWLLSSTKKVVDGIFCINSDGKQIFIEEGYPHVERIPLGFDPAYFSLNNEARNTIRNKLGLDRTTIAYFGRLVRQKGIHILINALQELKQYPWQLVMDDFNEYASAYNQEIRQLLNNAGIMDRVVFIKPNHFEIAAYMNATDIVVVPSVTAPNWKEQYGRVAAEAMACGRLVIASDSGSLPELLNGHGYLFPESNVAALKQLLENELAGKGVGKLTPEAIAEYAKQALSMNRQKHIMENSFKLLLKSRA